MKRALLPLLLLAACAGPKAPPAAAALSVPPFQLFFEPPESEGADAAELRALFTRGCADVERFFGRPFPGGFEVAIVPDRKTFDAVLPAEWGIGRSECWMVAAGWGGGVIAIAPRAWRSEACEHDPDDAGHVRRLLTHELVHVYHGEHNPSPDFVEVTGLDWFVEGLATHASGQLAEEHADAAREALASGAGPKDLATAWTGRYRYGVCGSLVAFVDREWGRSTLVELLEETDGARLLQRLGVTEDELLAAWRDAVLAVPAR